MHSRATSLPQRPWVEETREKDVSRTIANSLAQPINFEVVVRRFSRSPRLFFQNLAVRAEPCSLPARCRPKSAHDADGSPVSSRNSEETVRRKIQSPIRCARSSRRRGVEAMIDGFYPSRWHNRRRSQTHRIRVKRRPSKRPNRDKSKSRPFCAPGAARLHRGAQTGRCLCIPTLFSRNGMKMKAAGEMPWRRWPFIHDAVRLFPRRPPLPLALPLHFRTQVTSYACYALCGQGVGPRDPLSAMWHATSC